MSLRRCARHRRRRGIVDGRSEINGLGLMRANGLGQGVGDDALRIHGDARDGQAQLLRRRSEAGKRQGFGQHAVAGTAEKEQDAEDCGLATGKNGQPVDREPRQARREPSRGLFQFRLARLPAAGSSGMRENPARRSIAARPWAIRKSSAASAGCGGTFIDRSTSMMSGVSAGGRRLDSETNVPCPTRPSMRPRPLASA